MGVCIEGDPCAGTALVAESMGGLGIIGSPCSFRRIVPVCLIGIRERRSDLRWLWKKGLRCLPALMASSPFSWGRGELILLTACCFGRLRKKLRRGESRERCERHE